MPRLHSSPSFCLKARDYGLSAQNSFCLWSAWARLGERYVVFVPNQLTWHYRYQKVPQERIDQFHLELIELLHARYPGHTIVMLPQTYRSVINDYGYFCRLAERAAGKPVVVIDEQQSSDVQQKIIAGARMVIGERYHSIVFAINNRTPFVSLSYEHKMTGLLEKLGLLDRSVDVQGIFSDETEEACRRAGTGVFFAGCGRLHSAAAGSLRVCAGGI